jgi:FtsP/CotA-like multicopper oxidase with cupredoxin domain
VGNTPTLHARVGDIVQWDVLTIGESFHVFHPHGHRWLRNGVPTDSETLGPSEALKIRWKEDAPGVWYYHCDVESHQDNGMIGLYDVSR